MTTPETTPDDPRDLLGPLATPPPRPGLTRDVLAAAALLLAAHARRTSARAWLRPLVVALLPLPLLVVADVWLVRTLHAVLSWVLPSIVSTYLVAQYALALLLLATLGYAAVPLLAERQMRTLPEDAHA
jgi:hypothetical protein